MEFFFGIFFVNFVTWPLHAWSQKIITQLFIWTFDNNWSEFDQPLLNPSSAVTLPHYSCGARNLCNCFGLYFYIRIFFSRARHDLKCNISLISPSWYIIHIPLAAFRECNMILCQHRKTRSEWYKVVKYNLPIRIYNNQSVSCSCFQVACGWAVEF